MIIEITAAEAKLIESALDAYEQQASTDEMFSVIASSMFSEKRNREQAEAEAIMRRERIGKECAMRRRATIPLRAKLISAEQEAT